MQKGFAPILIVLLLTIVAAGAFYLGRTYNKPLLETSKQEPPSNLPPISTINSPDNLDQWTPYKIKNLNLAFKLPSNLAEKYGSLVEREVKGTRGTELRINFLKDSESLIIIAQSPEYTPIPTIIRPNEGGIEVGGPGISTPSLFQGFRIENNMYYGILSFGQLRELPTEYITQYRSNGMDIIKVKSLYSDYGMATHKIYPENPPKIWGIINGTGNKIYQGLTIEGVLDNELTEPVFDQILSTFKFLP